MDELSNMLSLQDNYAIITKNQYTIIGSAWKKDNLEGQENQDYYNLLYLSFDIKDLETNVMTYIITR